MTLEQQAGFKSLGTTKDGTWTKFVPATETTPEQRAIQRRENQERKAAQAAAEASEAARAMPAVERDRHYRQLLNGLNLHPDDQADLLGRGFTLEQIEAIGFKSVIRNQPLPLTFPSTLPGVTNDGRSLTVAADGYLCPTRNADGLIVGYQLRVRGADKGKYRWATNPKSKEYRENPLSIFRGSGSGVALVEGTGAKPALAAQRLGVSVIGAAGGQWSSSPKTLKDAIAKLGNPKAIKLYLDAGDTGKADVIRRWQRTIELLQDWGHEVRCWIPKGDRDIDELSPAELERLALMPASVVLELGKTSGRVAPRPTKEGDWLRQAPKDRLISREEWLAQKAEQKRQQWSERTAQIQKSLNNLSVQPHALLNQRFLGKLERPQGGGLMFVSSDCMTGKTHSLVELLGDYFKQYPSGFVGNVGYRNGLLRQTKERIGGTHVHDIDVVQAGKHWYYFEVGTGKKLDLLTIHGCINSLWKIHRHAKRCAEAGIPPIIILDEWDAIAKHILCGGLGRKAAELSHLFQDLLRLVLDAGGCVYAMEANLTDTSVNFLRDLAGGWYNWHLTVNQHHGLKFTANTYLQSIDDEGKALVNLRTAAAAKIIEKLNAGERVFLTTDVKAFGRKLAIALQQLGILTKEELDICDGNTSYTPEMQNFLHHPDNWLAERPQLRLMIATSTLESGASIEKPFFDSEVHLSERAEARAAVQHTSRVRLPIPRFIFATEYAIKDPAEKSLRPETLLRDKLTTNREGLRFSGLLSEAPEYKDKLAAATAPNTLAAVLDRYQAEYRARANGSKAQLRKSIMEQLEHHGHSVVEFSDEGITGSGFPLEEIEQALRDAGGQILDDTTEKFIGSDVEGKTLKWAYEIRDSFSSTEEDRIAAERIIISHNFPNLPWEERRFVRNRIVKSSARFLKDVERGWLAKNPQVARFLDREFLKQELDRKQVWIGKRAQKTAEASLWGLLHLEAFEDGSGYTHNDKRVAATAKAALQHSEALRRLWGYHVDTERVQSDPMGIVNRLLRKFGFEIKSTRKGKRDESRVRQYRVAIECSDRKAVIASLDAKYRELIDELEGDETTLYRPVSTFLDVSKSIYKMVDTREQGLLQIDGDTYVIRKTEGKLLWLAPPGAPDMPLHQCLMTVAHELVVA